MFLPDVSHGIPNLIDNALAALDAYLRRVIADDQRPHILACFTDNAQVNRLIGYPLTHDWAGWSGMTLRNKRWDWQAQCISRAAKQRVNISLCRVFSDDATMFGLITHEISHACGSKDGAVNVVGTASYWETLGKQAYLNAQDNKQRHLHGLITVLTA